MEIEEDWGTYTLHGVDKLESVKSYMSIRADRRLRICAQLFNTVFVGFLTVVGNVTAGDNTYVHICNNRYYVVTNDTMTLMAVAPGLAERVDCSAHVWTSVPASTSASTTVTDESHATTTGAGGSTNAPTLFPTTTAVRSNGTPDVSVVLATVAAVAALSAVIALLQ